MSVNALSATAIQHILNNISGSLDQNFDITKTAMTEASQRAGRSAPSNARVAQSQLTSAADRARTNNLQQGIITQNAAELLAIQFRDIVVKPKSLEEYTVLKVASGVSGKKGTTKTLSSFDVRNLVDKFVGINKDYSALKDYYLDGEDTFKELIKNEKYYEEVVESLNKKTKVLTDMAHQLFSNAEDLVKDFNEYIENKNVSKSQIVTDVKNATTSGLSHREFNNIFYEFLKGKYTGDKKGLALADFIDNNTDAGHLIGVYTVRIATLFSGNKSPGADVQLIDGIPILTIDGIQQKLDKENAVLNNDLTSINRLFNQTGQLLLNADAITSNLINNLQVFVDISRQNFQTTVSGTEPGSVVEVQLSKFNQEAGNKLAQTGKKLKALVEQAINLSGKNLTDENMSAQVTATRLQLIDFFNSFKSLADYIEEVGKELASETFRDRVEQKIVEKLTTNSKGIASAILNSEGSDTTYQSIFKTLKALLEGKTYTSKPTIVPTLKSKKLSNTAVKSLKSVNAKAKTPKLKVKPVNFAKLIPSRQLSTVTNLDKLMLLINSTLHDQIRKNMGTGSSKNVLNYQSGRLAESAEVTKMSESRAGMITAFYTYMRNPYATFSEGGAQSSPPSRDPKRLISKSIREILATQVNNRLRAVLA
jgi:hypothetical protein